MSENKTEIEYQVQALRVELQVAHAQLIECANFIKNTEKKLFSYDFATANQYNEQVAQLKNELGQIDTNIKSHYYTK